MLPQPLPPPPPLPEPRDIDYPGTIRLFVDATDSDRAILDVREVVPVAAAGPLILVYPEWLPGFHAAEGQIELLAGLKIRANGSDLAWRRDPVNVYAFHTEVPDGVQEIEVEFQHLSPTSSRQGRVAFSAAILNLQWNTVVLHPAGYYARRTRVQPSVRLPRGWDHACALRGRREGDDVVLEACGLDVLVDSPLYAGAHSSRHEIGQDVFFTAFADRPEQATVPPARIGELKNVVHQADALFGTRHFDRYHFLCALSREIGAIGVEHHRSCELGVGPDLFTAWDDNLSGRGIFCHEFVHSWNGKYRRGADSWQPCFLEPIRNSLMWVYEGLTQYWGEILTVRSGQVTVADHRGSLALTAATLAIRRGREWRPVSDTTRDPVIAARSPLPWRSWQRSEDYYSEGALMWLEVDVMLRRLSQGGHSLDDFARDFFGGRDGDWTTSLYTFDDVCAALNRLVTFDWPGYFKARLDGLGGEPPLGGLEDAGWRLEFTDTPNSFHRAEMKRAGTEDHQFSAGLVVGSEGVLKEVIWGSPAFQAGLRVGDRLLALDGHDYSGKALRKALREGVRTIAVTIRRLSRERSVSLHHDGGLRYPHLVRADGDDLLARICAAR
jgi:predicted metalloprotease with PDZ domain